MPELPEVKVVVSKLNEYVTNKTIKDIIIYKEKLFKEFDPSFFIQNLIGKTIKSITQRGKLIIFNLSDNTYLYSHLRMEGKYSIVNDGKISIRNLVVRFIFTDNTELDYHDSRLFGTFHIRCDLTKNLPQPYANIALEPKDVDPKDVFNKFQKSKTAIKTKLLDQSIMSGIGNIYADEILFKTKINPLMSSNKLSLEQVKLILNAAIEILDKSYKNGGTTIHSFKSLNNVIGSYQDYLMIHNDKIKYCKICKTPIKKIFVNKRGTYFCPTCQKESK